MNRNRNTEADDAIRGVAYLNTAVDREFAGLTPDESHHAPVVVMHPRTEADIVAEQKADKYDNASKEQQLGVFVTKYLINVEKRNPESDEWPFVYAENQKN